MQYQLLSYFGFFFITKKILQKIVIFRLLKQKIDAKFVEGYMVM